MKRASLKVEKREPKQRSFTRSMRAKGLVPANVYGRGLKNTFCFFDERELRKIFKGPYNSNTVLEFQSDDPDLNDKRVIVKSAAKDPSTWNTVHVDFYQFAEGQNLDVEIPLEFLGTPKGVKMSGGILQIVRRQISVRGSLDVLPEKIEVNISELDIDDNLHISDLDLPEGLKVLDSPSFTLASVIAQKEEEPTPVAAVAEATAEAGAAEATGDKEKKEETKKD